MEGIGILHVPVVHVFAGVLSVHLRFGCGAMKLRPSVGRSSWQSSEKRAYNTPTIRTGLRGLGSAQAYRHGLRCLGASVLL
jgi:hypothetical protein